MAVYFIQTVKTGHVKIGCSRDVNKRLRGLQTASFDKLLLLNELPGSFALESGIQRQLDRFRIKGTEWFLGHPDLMAELWKLSTLSAEELNFLLNKSLEQRSQAAPVQTRLVAQSPKPVNEHATYRANSLSSAFLSDLKKLRTERGISLQKLADQIGKTREYVRQVQAGILSISAEDVQALRGLVDSIPILTPKKPRPAVWPNISPKAIGVALKEARIKAGKSQLETSRARGTGHVMALSALERGAKRAKLRTLSAWCAAIGTDLDSLLNRGRQIEAGASHRHHDRRNAQVRYRKRNHTAGVLGHTPDFSPMLLICPINARPMSLFEDIDLESQGSAP